MVNIYIFFVIPKHRFIISTFKKNLLFKKEIIKNSNLDQL